MLRYLPTKASSRTSSLSTTSSSMSSSSGGNGDGGGGVGVGSAGDDTRRGSSTMIVAPSSSSSHVRTRPPRFRLCSHPGCSKQVQQGGVCCRHGARTSRNLCTDPSPVAVRTLPNVVDYVVDMGRSVLRCVVERDVNVFHVREDIVTHISH